MSRKNKSVTISIPEELYYLVQERACDNRISLSHAFTKALARSYNLPETAFDDQMKRTLNYPDFDEANHVCYFTLYNAKKL